MANIYKNIKQLRLLNDWSQETLAQKVGYADKTMISRVESGQIDLKHSQILAFAKAFNVTPGILLGSTENVDNYSALEKQIIDAYRKSTQKDAILILLGLDTQSQKKENLA